MNKKNYLIVLVLVFVIISALGVAGCSAQSENPIATPTSTVEVTPEPTENQDATTVIGSSCFDLSVYEWLDNFNALYEQAGIDYSLSENQLIIEDNQFMIAPNKHVYFKGKTDDAGNISYIFIEGNIIRTVESEFKFMSSIPKIIGSIHPEYTMDECMAIYNDLQEKTGFFYDSATIVADGTVYAFDYTHTLLLFVYPSE